MPKHNDGDLEEMRCRSCGALLGYRRRQGPFIFWCSEPCAETIMAKMEHDQIRDEVAVELYSAGVGMMDISRFTETGYTRIQQLLYRRHMSLTRPERARRDASDQIRQRRGGELRLDHHAGLQAVEPTTSGLPLRCSADNLTGELKVSNAEARDVRAGPWSKRSLEDLDHLYELLDELAERIGGTRRLSQCGGRMS
jgi:hypothetical protein